MENSYTKDSFQFIELGYLQQVSRGDLTYEQKIISLFVELVPDNLAEIAESYQRSDHETLKKALHQLQSSTAVMGLNEKLFAHWNMDAWSEMEDIEVKRHIDSIAMICTEAVEEAKKYLVVINC